MKTSLMLDVSVACVILHPMLVNEKVRNRIKYITNWGYTFSRARFACINRQRMYLAPLLTSAPPVYSGKNLSRGTYRDAGERWLKGVRD
jgi:hypothetical protein